MRCITTYVGKALAVILDTFGCFHGRNVAKGSLSVLRLRIIRDNVAILNEVMICSTRSSYLTYCILCLPR